ncbi:MAG: BNR repeat-containing protein [Flavobacteriaceae bacterium]
MKPICFFQNTNVQTILLICCFVITSCTSYMSYVPVGTGWNSNSVNAVKFRKNALITHENHQFIAYYNEDGYLVLGKRKLQSHRWQIQQTQYKGNVNDAHNSISLAVDGAGYLHLSWDQHNTRLRYAKSITPLGITLGGEVSMAGLQENKVTYPEFYNLPNGNLIFFYRSGESGRGNLVINHYQTKQQKWSQIQRNLIDGEDKRNAYWQACVDNKGTIHVSWVWRETWDVETNHDLCYARSNDGGVTWERSTGKPYTLPITLQSAEYACKIPEKSNLINQTAMTTNVNGSPFIVSYWNDGNQVPQYHVVYLRNGEWKTLNTGFRKTTFALGGGGTKRIPISRPDILTNQVNGTTQVSILFRDEERENKVMVAYTLTDETNPKWNVVNLTQDGYGQWEPNYDIALWNKKKKLHVFLQDVTQIDGEGLANKGASEVKIIEINAFDKFITSIE